MNDTSLVDIRERQIMVRRTFLAALAIGLATSTTALAQTEIQWWHAMTGANNDVVNKLAADFNASQTDYKVVVAYKGSYPDTLNAGIAAFRAGNAPHILQVVEVGTATMMAAKGAVKPVYQLMQEAGEKFDPKSYLPAITGYYSTAKGEMLSFPFNSSSMVMWINKESERRDPEDVARGVRGGQEAQGRGLRNLRLHLRLDDVGDARAVFVLAQRSACNQGERA
jgi:maltose-binding protein MalE